MTDERHYTREELLGSAPRTWCVVLATVGLLAIAAGTLLPILNVFVGPGAAGSWWKYVYAGGAVAFLVGKLLSPYTGVHPRIKRLYRIEGWSAVFFCVAAFFLFWNDGELRDVWAFTLAGGVLLVFTNIAIPIVARKAMKANSDSNEKSDKQ